MRRSNVALRLRSSLLEEARRVSEAEGVALNQFINVAVAEKLSALRTEEYFRERGQRGKRGEGEATVETRGPRKASGLRRRVEVALERPCSPFSNRVI
jgi:hypothetical protein